MTTDDRSRFEHVSRRAFLRRSAAFGAVAVGATGLLAACGTDDAAVFSQRTAAGDDTTSTTGAATTSTDGTAGTTTQDAATTATGDALPSGAELVVDFTFAASSSDGGDRGGVKNPYIAVWIEDAAGEMVRTVSLWLMSGKGERWWSDLVRWYEQDQARVAAGGVATSDTITGATRTPGDYSVAWDGTGYDGAVVARGDYFVCIEAAREHGPYELVRESVTLDDTGFTTSLGGNGELTNAEVTYVV